MIVQDMTLDNWCWIPSLAALGNVEYSFVTIAQSAGAVEYTDCTSAEE